MDVERFLKKEGGTGIDILLFIASMVQLHTDLHPNSAAEPPNLS